LQAEAVRLFAEKGFQATTIEEIAAAADVAPRTFFRYFSSKEEVVFWSEHQPMLAGHVAARPDDEPAAQALRHGLTDRLASFHGPDHSGLPPPGPAAPLAPAAGRPGGRDGPASRPPARGARRRPGGPGHRRRH